MDRFGTEILSYSVQIDVFCYDCEKYTVLAT